MSSHRGKTLFATIVTILFAGIFMTGCASAKTSTISPSATTPNVSQNTSTNSTPPVTPTPGAVTPSDSTQESVKLTLYFPNPDASGLVATERTVVVNNKETIKAMFKELETPPTGLEKPLPKGTTLLSAAVSADGVATLNLSSEFQKNFGGGSAGEQMTLYSIVNTLTTLPNVKSVQFLLDGKKMDGMLESTETSKPLKRNESIIIKK